MQLNRSSSLALVRIMSVILFIVLIGSYATWRSLNYFRGPKIIISSPANWSTITDHSAIISGQAQRISDIRLNGRSISIDEKGNFSETVIIFPGMNYETVSVNDQFGRSASQQLVLFGKNELPSQTEASTTKK